MTSQHQTVVSDNKLIYVGEQTTEQLTRPTDRMRNLNHLGE